MPVVKITCVDVGAVADIVYVELLSFRYVLGAIISPGAGGSGGNIYQP